MQEVSTIVTSQDWEDTESDFSSEFTKEDFSSPKSEYHLMEADLFYQSPSSPHAFYHRPVKVKGNISSFIAKNKTFSKHYGRVMYTRNSISTSTRLQNGRIWTVHMSTSAIDWAYVRGDHGSIPYQKRGFYVSWLRHNAYICQTNFPSIDLVVPMAFPNKDDVVTPECMSYIVISMKNRGGTEHFKSTYLSKKGIEGVVAPENENKKRKFDKIHVAGEGDGSRYVHGDDSNLRLTLNAVKFINPRGVVSATDCDGRWIDSDDRWIQSSEAKPYVAFAMSMGQTDRPTDLFIGEEVNSYQCSSDLYAAQCNFRSNRFRPQRPFKHIRVPQRPNAGCN
jgi:hypothetical protein